MEWYYKCDKPASAATHRRGGSSKDLAMHMQGMKAGEKCKVNYSTCKMTTVSFSDEAMVDAEAPTQ